MHDSCMSKVLARVVSPAAKTLLNYWVENRIYGIFFVHFFIEVCINSFGRKQQSYIPSKKLNYSIFLIPVDSHNPQHSRMTELLFDIKELEQLWTSGFILVKCLNRYNSSSNIFSQKLSVYGH